MRRHILFGLVAVFWAAAFARDSFETWVNTTDLPALLNATSTEVRDRNGALLRVYTVDNGLWRLGAAPQNVDPKYLEMLVAFEDKRFFAHSGVDPLAMLRATGQALAYGKVVSGGSTLTMQVARLLEDSGTGRWRGKLRQIRVALALEKRLDKDQILTLYLTHAPYGGNLEGIRAATLSWYGKEPTRLTPAQSAFLIALPQSPETRRPDRNFLSARDARNQVLDRLTQAGTLLDDTANAAKSEPIPHQRHPFPAFAPHLSDRATTRNRDARRHDLTIDMPLQKSLERLATKALRGKEERLSIAMLVADHNSGEILASVGSAGFSADGHRNGFVDMTQAIRSPGSTLKPLIYAMGFDQGLVHPQTLIDDRPVKFGTYAPQNFDGQFRGQLRVADALRLSLNIPVVLLTDQIGPARLMSAMKKSGADPVLPSGKAGLAIALGGIGLSLHDLTTLYAMQARGGKAVKLRWRKEDPLTEGERILSRAAAWQVGHILSEMAPPAGASNMRLAFKTGTSYGHRDAWAVGYDGSHVAAVWIGRPDGTPVPGAFGGDLAAPVLFDVFQRLKPKLAPFGPPPPETLILSTAQLPLPLQRFRGRNAVFQAPPNSLELSFPPNGARLEGVETGLAVKVRHGKFPLTILANGHPLATDVRQRTINLPFTDKGASVLTVIDAAGRSDRVEIWID